MSDLRLFAHWFCLCPKTGDVLWRVDTKNRNPRFSAGKKAGNKTKDGYINIELRGRQYKAHRIAWLLHYKSWPKYEIDHINGNKSDNRICNLRDVEKRINLSNQHKHRKGKLVGCSYQKSRKTWKAKIVVNKKEIYLGAFKTELAAHRAYLKALNSISK